LGVAVDSAGTLYVADTANQRIRKVSNGVITTVAGDESGPDADNIPATSAALNLPSAVAVDSAGNLYIADFPLAQRGCRHETQNYQENSSQGACKQEIRALPAA
jgi:sugar lactone lactonase YvrE